MTDYFSDLGAGNKTAERKVVTEKLDLLREFKNSGLNIIMQLDILVIRLGCTEFGGKYLLIYIVVTRAIVNCSMN